MKEIQSWIERLGERRDVIDEKLEKKEIKLPTELVTGIFFLLLGGILLLVMPSQVPVSHTDVVNGRAFPTLLMIIMMICSCIIFL